MKPLAAATLFAGLVAAIQPDPVAQSGTQARRPALAAGDTEIALTHAGRRRLYRVHMPPKIASPAPVLLAFHGGGGNAEQFQSSAGLDTIANREGFVVVYPHGSGLLPRRLLTWNAGEGCCGYARQQRVDDVGFAAAVVDDLAARVSVDRRRVYATGHSNGGMMAHRLAAERADLVAAAVAVAGALDLARIAPSHPVPILQIHSVDDPRALYDGGLGPPFPGTNNRVQHEPVMAGLEQWAAANGCAPMPATAETRRGTAGRPDATHSATLLVWPDCREGATVAHWRLTVAGHGWPGEGRPAGGERLAGPATSVISAAEEIWKFVSRYRR